MKLKIGIIGKGNVGSALQKGLAQAGYEAINTNRDNAADIVKNSDVVVLAVPFTAIDDVLKNLGSALDGKVVIDATNAVTPEFELAVGFTTSGAENLQKKAPNAKVVKAFNTVFAQHMSTGKLDGKTLSAFVASDDAVARKTVLSIAKDMGFDAIDSGPLANSRQLEALGFFNIQLGYFLKNGTDTGFIYTRK